MIVCGLLFYDKAVGNLLALFSMIAFCLKTKTVFSMGALSSAVTIYF
ncbi:protein of unknown function [Candidatus Methylacidiphilum fumarolicum]|uniref:Uncharacterized protein n=1 Tax=Candidatus Methylacidiphilum fumarolicum TaxID=591154 RepID=A0ABN8XJQ5_9BACT|nr:protein of unknown function [Candidatus Methylacidiphilum fumarolicum]